MTPPVVMPIKVGESDHLDLAPLNVIRTETVLSRMPFHNLAKKGRVDIRITKRNKNGETDLYWRVSPNADYGEPRQLAYKIDTLVINYYIEIIGRPLPKIIRLGSLRDICKILGLADGGTIKSSVKNALLQNAFAAITAKLHYKDKDGTERTLEAGFTRYSVIFTGEHLPNGKKADAVYLILNDPYLDVLNNAPVRPLDCNYLKQLQPAPQRFYELISYKIFTAIKYHHPHAKIQYSELCTFAPQQRYDNYTQFKKQMYKIHRPHIQSGYIEPRPKYEEITDDTGNLDWMMCYVPGPKAKAEYKAFNSGKAVGKKHMPVVGASTTDTITTVTEQLELAQPVGEYEIADTPVAPPPETTLLTQHTPTQSPPNTKTPLSTNAAPTPVPSPSTTAPPPDPKAIALVQYFHEKFHQATNITPTIREINHATQLLTEQGREKAQHLIDYSHNLTATSTFTPHTFGGIMHFLPESLTAYDKAKQELAEKQAQAHTAQQKAHEDHLKDQYEAYYKTRITEIRAHTPGIQLGLIHDQVKAQLAGDRIPFGRDTMIRLATDKLLAEQHRIPTYEEWRATLEEGTPIPMLIPNPTRTNEV